MRVLVIILLVLFCVHSCHRICSYTSGVVYTTAGDVKEAVRESASHITVNVKKAVNDSYDLSLVESPALQQAGIQQGKYIVGEDSIGNDNKLSVYLVFNKEVARPVTAKIFDEEGHEYGRATVTVNNKAGEAKFYSFTFNKETDIEEGSRVELE